MGRRGPPPKPRAKKVLEGTFRKDRDSGAPDPPVRIPAPPPALGEIALREWNRLAPLLASQGLMAEDYRDGLACYCAAFQRWELAEKALAHPATQQLGLGDRLIGVANKALEIMRKFMVEYGLTPSSRTRVHASKKPGKKNPFLEAS